MKLIKILILLLLTASCRRGIQNGDLIFVRASEGEFSEAIDAATKVEGEKSFDHIAIGMVRDGEAFVVEAAPLHGVVCRPYSEFAAENGAENIEIVALKRKFDSDLDISRAMVISRALGFVGRPYDFYFLPGDEALYCSELVYESYIYENGEHIFNQVPMNFRASDGTMPEYWIKHFANIGMEVPEGVEGTNPNMIYSLLQLLLVKKN